MIKIGFLPKALREVLARTAASKQTPLGPKAKGTMQVIANGNKATLQIYGDIGDDYWDDESISAKSVVNALAAFSGNSIDVRINSFGGAVHDGIAIHNELRRQAASGVGVNVFIDGVACSIASLIACAGDVVTMPSNTMLMLHAPWGMLHVEGNAKDVRENAEDFAQALDTFGSAMSASYARKTGKPTADFDAMWATGKDFYFTAQQAADFGLCDVVTDGETAAENPPLANFESVIVGTAPPPELKSRIADAYAKGTARMPIESNQPLASASVNLPSTLPGVSTGESVMDQTEIKAKADLEAKALADKQRGEFQAAMRDRNTEIRAMAEPHCGNAEVRALVDDAIAGADMNVTAATVGSKILAILAKGRGPIGDVTITADERDNRIKGMSEALDARVGRIKPSAMEGNYFRGMSLKEMAKEMAAAAGVNVRGMQPEEYIKAAITHTSSDFPQLIGNSVSRAVIRGYNETPEVYSEFTRAINVPDFKKTSLTGLGNFVGITEIKEGAEYKYGTFASMGQEVKLVKRGGMFSITDEAIINDDLSLFDQVPAKMGAAAKRSLGDSVFALLTSNPVLADGVTLFHATHRNLLTAAAPSTASVDQMIGALALQKDSTGAGVRAPLKFILVPVGLGGLVRQILDSQYEIGATKNNTTPNYVRGRFIVIEDPRLDANSTTAWYGIADPAVMDALVIAYRNGDQEPKTEQKQGWSIDGIEFKVRLDAAPAIADYVGLAKNPGV